MASDQFHFSDFTFDVSTGELSSPRETVRLQPQPAAALRLLLENAGQLVTREALKRTIWPDTVVEADQGLNFCVRQIRLALGEDADGGQFIETLPRRGYRFVVPVTSGSDSRPTVLEPARANAEVQEVEARSPIVTRGATVRLASILFAVIALVVSAYFVKSTGAPSANVLAILPLHTDNASETVADQNSAVTEALVAALTNSARPKYGIVGPATTAQFITSTEPHTQLGVKLQADFVVSGGVRMSDSTMFVQAIRVTDGVHVFAWRQPLNGRNAVQLATIIASELAVKVK